MNLFNSFQAVAFYTALPIAIQWLFQNQHDVWGYMASAVCFVGYVMLSFAASDATK